MFTPFSALLFFVTSGASAYLLSRQIRFALSRSVRLLARLVLWETVQVVPVQLFAALQMAGWVSRVTVPALAALQAAILAGIAVWCRAPSRPLPADAEREAQRDGPLPKYVFVACIVLLGSYLAFAANAFTGFPSGSDAVIYHLPLALRWLQQGSLAIPASRAWQYSLSGNAEIGMMILLSSGRESTVILASWLPAGIIAVSTYLLAMWVTKRNRVAAAIVCVIVLSIPMFEFQILSAYVDLLGTAGVLAAFTIVLTAGNGYPEGGRSTMFRWPMLMIAGLACGISVGTKPIYYLYGAGFAALVAGLFWANRNLGTRTLFKRGLLVGAAILLPSIFWFVRDLKQTGNPVYPIQFRIGSRIVFPGYVPSEITRPDFEFNFVHQKREWLFYPWTEWSRDPGYLKVPYGEGEGLGAVFATFIPLGILFFAYRTWVSRSRSDSALLLAFVGLSLAWWTVMERVPRFGQAIVIFACILAAPLMVRLQSVGRRSFAALLVISVAVTCAISASVPLHELAGRVRTQVWERSRAYSYPQLIDDLPAGSIVVNATGVEERNFALAGKRLTNRVIASFEAPLSWEPDSIREMGAAYIVETVPGGKYPEISMLTSGAKLIDDELVTTGEKQVRWRIWKIERKKWFGSLTRPDAG